MVIINVLDDVPINKNRAEEQLKAFEKFFSVVKNSDAELGEDFDKIMSQRFNITRELDL